MLFVGSALCLVLPPELVSHSGVWLCICRPAAERRTLEPLQEATHLHLTEHLPPLEPPSPETPSSPTQPPSSAEPLPPAESSSPAQPSFSSPSHSSFMKQSFLFLKSSTQSRTLKTNTPPPSRLESSLLKYTPVQYSRMLNSGPVGPNGTLRSPPEPDPPASPVQSGRDEVDADAAGTRSPPEESAPKPRSGAPQVYSPFMKLMEISKNIKIE